MNKSINVEKYKNLNNFRVKRIKKTSNLKIGSLLKDLLNILFDVCMLPIKQAVRCMCIAC